MTSLVATIFFPLCLKVQSHNPRVANYTLTTWQRTAQPVTLTLPALCASWQPALAPEKLVSFLAGMLLKLVILRAKFWCMSLLTVFPTRCSISVSSRGKIKIVANSFSRTRFFWTLLGSSDLLMLVPRSLSSESPSWSRRHFKHLLSGMLVTACYEYPILIPINKSHLMPTTLRQMEISDETIYFKPSIPSSSFLCVFSSSSPHVSFTFQRLFCILQS